MGSQRFIGLYALAAMPFMMRDAQAWAAVGVRRVGVGVAGALGRPRPDERPGELEHLEAQVFERIALL